MISKVLKANSFYHTCRYVCQKKGAEILSTEGVREHDYKLMAEDFLIQQQLRPSKHIAVLHAILSFDPSEKLSDELMKEIALEYLNRLGVVNTQFSITKHTDTKHPHLHVIANMVNNEGKSITDSWIGLKGKKIAQRLTQEYRLVPALEKNLKQTHLEALNEKEACRYKIYQAISEILPYCKTMNDLEGKLLQVGIETQYKYKGQTQEKQGISFKIGNLSYKGSQVDRNYSLGGLQKILSKNQKQDQRQTTSIANPVTINRHRKAFSQNHSAVDRELSTNEIFPTIDLHIGKIIGELLKPVPGSGGGGGGGGPKLTDEEIRRRKKKKRPHW